MPVSITLHRDPGPARWAGRTASGLWAAMLLALAPAHAATNPPTGNLGTLLFSAAERRAVTSGRHGDADATAPATRMTVDGVVMRTQGHGTVWVNGQAVPEGQPAPSATRMKLGDQGVTLNGVALRVGETLDLTTRERSDIVTPGAVTVKRPK